MFAEKFINYRSVWVKLFFATFFSLLSANAQGVSVSYYLEDLGNGYYRYDYSVANNGSLGGDVNIGLFSVYFDPLLVDELSITIVSDANISGLWSEIILGSGVGVPAAYDILALSGGIEVGETVTGFSVEFYWIGLAANPGAQEFEIFDPDTFESLELGQTSLVPLPAPIILFSSALVSTILIRRRHFHTITSPSN